MRACPPRIILLCGLCLTLTAACTPRLPQNGPVAPGLYLSFFNDESSARKGQFLVRVPESAGERPPLLIALHGVSNDGQSMEKKARLDAFAERHGMVALYPHGMGLFGVWRHWNAGFCCGFAHEKSVDDTAFVLRCMERVRRRLNVDDSRIYIIGHSNGGMLAYALASRRPELFRAVAVVSATAGGTAGPGLPFSAIAPPHMPVPLIAVHGEKDQAMPPQGGASPDPFLNKYGERLSLQESLALWLSGNGCAEPPVESRRCAGRVLQQDWCAEDGRRRVRLALYKGWPHAWPGPGIEGLYMDEHGQDVYEALGLEPLPEGCSAEELIAEFFGLVH